jgi:hypothetical protein
MQKTYLTKSMKNPHLTKPIYDLKTLSKLGMERNLLNLSKNLFKIPIVNIIPYDEKLDTSPLR